MDWKPQSAEALQLSKPRDRGVLYAEKTASCSAGHAACCTKRTSSDAARGERDASACFVFRGVASLIFKSRRVPLTNLERTNAGLIVPGRCDVGQALLAQDESELKL